MVVTTRSARRATSPVARGVTRALPLLAVPLLLAASATAAAAQSYRLLLQGTLDARSGIEGAGGARTPFGAATPFTFEAYFDTRTPNLVATLPFPPFVVPGFVAYAPSVARFTVDGRTYLMESFDATLRPLGIGVSIFDATTPFGPPNRYGVGFIQNPLLDGAGMIADYLGASPPFVIGTGGLTTTTFTGYQGVGVTSGVCVAGVPGNCQQYADTPIPLTWNGQGYALYLGSYEQHAAGGGPTFSASLQVVPEPGSLALLATGALGMAGVTWRRRARVTG